MVNTSEIELVNCIASGEIDAEIDLEALLSDLDFNVSYIKGPGLYFRFESNGPTCVIARTGKYFFTGVKSVDETYEMKDRLLSLFVDFGIIDTPSDPSFSIKNMVFTSDLGVEIDLNRLFIELGIEKTEFEPEQFPGLIYRPEQHGTVFLIFSTGKVVITGSKKKQEALESYRSLVGILNNKDIVPDRVE